MGGGCQRFDGRRGGVGKGARDIGDRPRVRGQDRPRRLVDDVVGRGGRGDLGRLGDGRRRGLGCRLDGGGFVSRLRDDRLRDDRFGRGLDGRLDHGGLDGRRFDGLGRRLDGLGGGDVVERLGVPGGLGLGVGLDVRSGLEGDGLADRDLVEGLDDGHGLRRGLGLDAGHIGDDGASAALRDRIASAGSMGSAASGAVVVSASSGVRASAAIAAASRKWWSTGSGVAAASTVASAASTGSGSRRLGFGRHDLGDLGLRRLGLECRERVIEALTWLQAGEHEAGMGGHGGRMVRRRLDLVGRGCGLGFDDDVLGRDGFLRDHGRHGLGDDLGLRRRPAATASATTSARRRIGSRPRRRPRAQGGLGDHLGLRGDGQGLDDDRLRRGGRRRIVWVVDEALGLGRRSVGRGS